MLPMTCNGEGEGTTIGPLWLEREFLKGVGVVVNRSLTMSHFENFGTKMFGKYWLKDNNHLKMVYEKRAEWVPTFFQSNFFANMTMTQKSEGMN